jgi:hypothetical protein
MWGQMLNITRNIVRRVGLLECEHVQACWCISPFANAKPNLLLSGAVRVFRASHDSVSLAWINPLHGRKHSSNGITSMRGWSLCMQQ